MPSAFFAKVLDVLSPVLLELTLLVGSPVVLACGASLVEPVEREGVFALVAVYAGIASEAGRD